MFIINKIIIKYMNDCKYLIILLFMFFLFFTNSELFTSKYKKINKVKLQK